LLSRFQRPVGDYQCVSWVSNFILVVDYADVDVVLVLSDWLKTDAPQREGAYVDAQGNAARGVGWLGRLSKPHDNHWGGRKNPECEVWAGALNHAALPALLDRVFTAPWRNPEQVQVLLMDQPESYFRLYMCRGGVWGQYAPPPTDDAT
jgi:hypothetical protein